MDMTRVLKLAALGGLASLAVALSAPAGAMPAAPLAQLQVGDVVQIYHRGRAHKHKRTRVTVYPRAAYGAPYGTPYYYDDLSQYPYTRGFGDRNPVPRGNMRGCTIDLGYGRYEPCEY